MVEKFSTKVNLSLINGPELNGNDFWGRIFQGQKMTFHLSVQGMNLYYNYLSVNSMTVREEICYFQVLFLSETLAQGAFPTATI